MNPCHFVRKNCAGYEYGRVVVSDTGTKQEKREYVVQGHADTYESALAANNMALEGKPQIGFRPTSLVWWEL